MTSLCQVRVDTNLACEKSFIYGFFTLSSLPEFIAKARVLCCKKKSSYARKPRNKTFRGMNTHIRLPHTSSTYAAMFSSLIQTILSVLESHQISRYLIDSGSRTIPPVGNCTLPRRTFYFALSTITLFCSSCKPLLYFSGLIFMVRLILFLGRSTASTCTSTTSPTLTASSGCLIKRSVIWDTCTRPS